jgi:hypothetical protein
MTDTGTMPDLTLGRVNNETQCLIEMAEAEAQTFYTGSIVSA